MEKQDLEKQKLDEERQKIIETMKRLKEKREEEILESGLDIKIIDVQYLGKINWIEEIEGENTEKQKDIYRIIEERQGQISYKYYDEDLEMIAAQRQADEELLPDEKYMNKEDKSFLEDIEELGEEKESLNEIEEEEKSKEGSEEKDEVKKRKPDNVVQTIDVDETYVDDWTTVRQAYGIPHGVQKLSFRDTNSKDVNPLSSKTTIDMVDSSGYVVEKIGEKGITIHDLFKIDDATGYNPTYDDNTKLELEGYAEKNKGQTKVRFQSKINPELYLSTEQKEVGGYVQVYSERRTQDGAYQGMQLETVNEEIQTNSNVIRLNRATRGDRSAKNIDREADFHENHGDDEEKIALKNSDGDRRTVEACDNNHVLDTNIDWKQLALRCGYRGDQLESGIEIVKQEFHELRNDSSNSDKNNEELMEQMVDERQETYRDIERNTPNY